MTLKIFWFFSVLVDIRVVQWPSSSVRNFSDGWNPWVEEEYLMRLFVFYFVQMLVGNLTV
jgi:hypothetical protein